MKVYNVRGGFNSSNGKNKFSRNSSSYSSVRADVGYIKKSFLNWIDENNNFYFQIIAIVILTLALFISFSSLSGTSSASVFASDESDDVYITNNFNRGLNSGSERRVVPSEIFSVSEDGETEESEAVVVPQTDVYIVRQGESLYYICGKLEVDCDEVKELNGLEYPYSLSVGQRVEFFVD